MGSIAERLRINLEKLMELDRKTLEDVENLRSDLSQTLRELEEEAAKD